MEKDDGPVGRKPTGGEIAERAETDGEVPALDGKTHGGIILGARD